MDINWKEIQEYYDQGFSIRDCMRKFGYSWNTYNRAKNRGDLITRDISKSMKVRAEKFGAHLHSEETKQKMKDNPNHGGARQGAGRGKSGWYNGIWCDSTWELAFVYHHLKNYIPIVRNKEGFEYIYNKDKFKYYPDFIVGNEYYEIKGYMTPKDRCKHDQFPFTLHVVGPKEIDLYLKEVKENHGYKFFETLYE
jgi:hypothetical protein